MRVAVAVQGGAMRSIYCAGAARAVAESPILGQITSIHSSSAGCVAGAILTSCIRDSSNYSAEAAVERFVSALGGNRFINSRRWSNIVDIDYLLEMLASFTELRISTLADIDISFRIAMTDWMTGELTHQELNSLPSDTELFAALRGSMAIPILYRRPAVFGSRRYADGGLCDPLPVFDALGGDPDLVLALASEPIGWLAAPPTSKEACFVKASIAVPTELRRVMLARKTSGDLAAAALRRGSFAGVRLVTIQPSNPSVLGSRLDKRRGHLDELETMGYTDAIRVLEALS